MAAGSARRTLVLLLAILFAVSALLALVVHLNPSWSIELWRTGMRWSNGASTAQLMLDGQRVSYDRLGHASQRPPLILVHGLRGEATVGLPLAKELARLGHEVIVIDLPGHGSSDESQQPMTLDTAGRLTLRAAQRIAPNRKPVLIGHSLGGWICAWQALRAPDQVASLVLISSAGTAFDIPPFPLLLSTDESGVALSMPLIFAKPPPVIPTSMAKGAADRKIEASLDLLRSAISGKYLLEGLLAAQAVPTLIVFGSEDRLISPDVGRNMATEIGSAKYVEIEGSGHMVLLEDPVRLAGEIDEFLDADDGVSAKQR